MTLAPSRIYDQYVESGTLANEEAIEAWDGVLFDRFVTFRDLVADGLGAHGAEALRLHPPLPGERVLDIGCGFGDTTQRLAELAGAEGEAVGVDASRRFIDAARSEAEEASVRNASFFVADVETTPLGEGFDLAFSRMGVMFFANPVAALRNVRRSLVPGGRVCFVVWRTKVDNEWVHRAERVVDNYLEEPEETDEPTCGPGPFSMAGADTTSGILRSAGFEGITLRRCDIPIKIGHDLDHAVAFNLALGPAGELMRLAAEDAERLRPEIEAKLRDALADLEGPAGVIAPASTWIVTATVPAGDAG